MDPTGDDPRYPVHAPGWAAIDRAFARHYPGQTPHQFTSSTAYELESLSPLPAISVYEAASSPPAPAFWHYVTYGLTELFEKGAPDPDISGFGFELTFRIERKASEDVPPTWPLRLLQGVGQYLLSGHGAFDAGHVIDLGGSIVPADLGAASALEGVVAVPDPELGKITTPHGSALFLLLVGLARPEMEAVQTWKLDRTVGLVREATLRGVTMPGRVPWPSDPQLAPVYLRYALDILRGEV